MIVELLILSLLLLYGILFYCDNFKGRQGRPPGPLSIPPFGNLIQIALKHKHAHVGLYQMAKIYGDIMSVKMGVVNAVILSSPEAIRALFSRDECTGRDCTGLWWDRNLKQNIGIVFSELEPHAETRKWCRDTLRTYGYGDRKLMHAMLLDELDEFSKVLEDSAVSNPLNVVHFKKGMFRSAFLNIMCTLFVGTRFNYSDPVFQNMLHHHNEFMKNGLFGAGIMTAFPVLRHIFPQALGYNAQMEGILGYCKIALNFLHERRNRVNPETLECFTDDFVQKMDQDAKTSPRPLFTEDHFAVVFSDIVQAGTDTTSNIVNFLVLLLMTHPHVQEKVHQEILHEIGTGRSPRLEDKTKMPFTQATLLEGIRWNRTVVMGAPRRVLADFVYRNYLFRKGTVLMSNIHSIFFDQEIWGDPEVFRPERFIGPDGHFDEKKASIVQLQFGAGKRVCFGEVLARDSLFLFTTCLVQKFKFTLPPGDEPELEPQMALNLYPKPYNCIVTLRH